MKGYVIYNKEHGVFIGECMGMGFWSNLDPVDQPEAVSFETVDIANSVLDRFKEYDKKYNYEVDYQLVPVEITSSHGITHYASVQSCVKAGLSAWEYRENTIEM